MKASRAESFEQIPATNPSSATSESSRPAAIVVAATFTADPINGPLTFWMQALQIDATVELAP